MSKAHGIDIQTNNFENNMVDIVFKPSYMDVIQLFSYLSLW